MQYVINKAVCYLQLQLENPDRPKTIEYIGMSAVRARQLGCESLQLCRAFGQRSVPSAD